MDKKKVKTNKLEKILKELDGRLPQTEKEVNRLIGVLKSNAPAKTVIPIAYKAITAAIHELGKLMKKM